jgi:endonuclease/exonuclease/phosphatase family metal-dependent hydrolase
VDATAPNLVIDYVLTRSLDHWEVGEIEVADDEVASDHPAVLVELKWSSEA